MAVAIRIKQEPLALFGMSAAMLAPLLVSHDVTTGGVLFGAVMVAASLPLLVRFGWRHLVTSVWVIGFAETLGLLALSSDHLGFGGPVDRRGRHGGALRGAHLPPGAPCRPTARASPCSAR